MRLILLVFGSIWGLVACTSQPTITVSTPVSSPVTLTVDNTQIEFTTLAGWNAYTEERNIVLSNRSNEQRNVIINVWLPELDIPQDFTVVDVIEDITFELQSEDRVTASQPVATSWSGQDAVYFTLNDLQQRTAMILVVNVNQTIVAFNISGIQQEFRAMRTTLMQMFDDFTVNGVELGSDIFQLIPDTLVMPPTNPETALEGSSEPSDP